MTDSDNIPSTEKISGVIPFFFYDVIGHIVPGSTLLLGLAWYFKGMDILSWIRPVHNGTPTEPSGADAALLVLLFFGIAQIAGVLLKPISYWIVERWITNNIEALSMEGMRKFCGLKDIEDIKRRFKTYFKGEVSEKEEEDSINRASFFCTYYTMRVDPNLGLMASRWDAELLSSQSLCIVLLFFTFLPLYGRYISDVQTDHHWGWMIFFALATAANYATFWYLRQKRVYGRFQLFITLTSKAPIMNQEEPR